MMQVNFFPLKNVPPKAGFFFDRAKKTQGRKNSKLKQKTQGFGKFWCNLLQKSTEMTKKQGGNYYI